MKKVFSHLIGVFVQVTPLWLFLIGVCALSRLAIGAVGYSLSVFAQRPMDPSIIITTGIAGIIIGVVGSVLR